MIGDIIGGVAVVCLISVCAAYLGWLTGGRKR